MIARIVTGALVLFALQAAPGLAGSPDRTAQTGGQGPDLWTGLYVGIGADLAQVADRSTEFGAGTADPNGFSGLTEDSLSAPGFHIGYGFAFDDVVLSLEARVQKGRTYSKDGQIVAGTRSAFFDTSYSSDRSWQVVARTGMRHGAAGLAYVMAGIAGADYTRGYYSSGAPDGEFFRGTEHGKVFGVGYEQMVSDHLSARCELSRTFYDSVSLSPQQAWSGLDDVHRASKTSLSVALSAYF